MTRDELKLRLQRAFENTTYYAQTDFNASIQDGYDEVTAFSGCILKAVSIPFVANLTYYDMITAIPDYIGVVAMFNATTRRWMIPISLRKFDGERWDWETAAGTPYYFAPVNHRYVAIFKKPIVANYGNVYIFYRASAPTLAASDSIQIPDDYIDALEDYCITDLWEQNEEWNKAGVHLDTYGEMLSELHLWVHSKRNPSRMPSLK